MSLYPILWASEHAPIYDAEERAILIALVIKGDFDGLNCFRSYGTLGKVARVDTKTAGRKCREMEARGILRRQDRHVSRAWHKIPDKQRPVVWEVMIPATWWSAAQLEEINEQREGLGRPPLTPENRPALAPAPPKKTRADKGQKRPKAQVKAVADPGTTSPRGTQGLQVPTPGTSSPHPPDLKSPPPGLEVPLPSESPSESPSETKNPVVPTVGRKTSGSSARAAAPSAEQPSDSPPAEEGEPHPVVMAVLGAVPELWAALRPQQRGVAVAAVHRSLGASPEPGIMADLLARRWFEDRGGEGGVRDPLGWLLARGLRVEEEVPEHIREERRSQRAAAVVRARQEMPGADGDMTYRAAASSVHGLIQEQKTYALQSPPVATWHCAGDECGGRPGVGDRPENGLCSQCFDATPEGAFAALSTRLDGSSL